MHGKPVTLGGFSLGQPLGKIPKILKTAHVATGALPPKALSMRKLSSGYWLQHCFFELQPDLYRHAESQCRVALGWYLALPSEAALPMTTKQQSATSHVHAHVRAASMEGFVWRLFSGEWGAPAVMPHEHAAWPGGEESSPLRPASEIQVVVLDLNL